jgi:hypothetical protein
LRRVVIAFIAAAAATAALTSVANAEFPYSTAPGDKHDWTTLRNEAGEFPNDLGDDWKYAATPEPSNFPVNADPRELNGVRGASIGDQTVIPTAWTFSNGRPDVVIAVLDSGIKWNSRGDITELRLKVHLNAAELPTPNHSGSAQENGANCASYANADDANGDGVVDIRDFACDSRVRKDTSNGVGPKDLLDPQDVLIPFSDGKDDDGNGFTDDIAGWDFLDDDNDAYDDVQYGHGTGEARDSTGEANTGGGFVGSCPNCTVIPLRVGDSFVADSNRFAQAAIYATDNGASVVQEALGTLNNTQLARRAIDYAYNHGTVVIASAADEAAQHHNYVSSLPHTVVVNAADRYPDGPPEGPMVPRSYLAWSNCTNFSSKIAVAVPSSSCSSGATGYGAGIAGLIYSQAINSIAAGRMQPHPTCKRPDGSACPISANEVRQLMASGTNGNVPKADGTFDPIADDVNWAGGQPEPTCSPAPSPGCTDPNLALTQQTTVNRPIVYPPDTRSYPARYGHDQFYGWGRVNARNSVKLAEEGRTPPEVEITSPDWFAQIDPGKPTAEIRAQVWNRGLTYSCKVYAAPGSYPNNHLTTDSPPGDFKQVASPVCNGNQRTDPVDGTVAALDLNDLKSRFPSDAGDFNGRESGQGAGQTSNGRPNSEPYGFTVKIIATRNPGVGGQVTGASGEDRRNFYLHRDQDLLDGFPKQLPSDGESSPAFADLDGDNRNELVFATADGIVHAMRPDGSELPGWPAHGDPAPLHTGGRAFSSGEVPATASYGTVLSSVAVGDLDRDGSLEVVIGDFEGKIYVRDGRGKLLWKRETNTAFSGKPLSPFANVRNGARNRTQHGFIASPVLADLDRSDGGRLEVVLAAMDRHVYALEDDGSSVPGYPVLVVDLKKVKSIDPTTHAVAFDNTKTGSSDDALELLQGAIIDTPAVGNVAGDAKPEIVVGTNEEYYSAEGDEGGTNISGNNAASVQLLAQTGALANANSRLYAIKPEGDRDGKPGSGDWLHPGWPAKLAILTAHLLPVVGEGVTGAPAIAPVDCPSGGAGSKIGTFANTGVAYVFNGDGTSCLGRSGGKDVSMDSDKGSGNATDHPAFPAVGHPAFGDIGGGVSLLGPVAGLARALDALLPEYQITGQDQLAAWDPATGDFRQGFPARMNDLQFITGPSVADIDGQDGEEVVEGSASLDLQAYNGSGQPVNDRWPKLSSDWIVANPLIGTFGTLDSDSSARRTVVASTRSGLVLAYRTDAPACQDGVRPLGSWPRFHHDPANSGDYSRDGVIPGASADVKLFAAGITLRAPGDELMCGKVKGYELVQSDRPLTGATFEEGDPIPLSFGAGALVEPGKTQGIGLGGNVARYLSVRAVDEQGNVGPVTTISTRNVLPGTPPELENAAANIARCGDRKPPLSRLSSKSGYTRKRKRLAISGRTADRGCRNLKAANAIAETVSIAKREGKRCRFLRSDRKLSERRSCKRPIKLRARGKYSTKSLKLTWSLVMKVRLPRGLYVAHATAVDQSGNRETRKLRKNSRSFRVR